MGRLVAIAVLVPCGCMPPPMNVGYVAMNPSGRGGVDVQGQVGLGGAVPGGAAAGGATAQVEPFVAPRVSIPVGIGVGGGVDGGFAPLRVGVRHRPAAFVAYGAGLGPSAYFDRATLVASGVADVEVVFGLQRPRVGFSVGLRPALAFDRTLWSVYALCDPSVAITVAPGTSLTAALPFGLMHARHLGTLPFVAGALGVHRRF